METLSSVGGRYDSERCLHGTGGRPCHNLSMPEHYPTVSLSEPGVAGSYVITEQRADGSLLLRPETVDEVIDEFADRVLSEDEHEEMFRRLRVASAEGG